MINSIRVETKLKICLTTLISHQKKIFFQVKTNIQSTKTSVSKKSADT